MRAIKRATKANSKANNQMIDHFMMDYLFSEIKDEMFDEFEESPINESLQIHNIKDLEALVELIKEKIDLKTIATCKLSCWKRRVRLTPSGTRDLTPRAK